MHIFLIDFEAMLGPCLFNFALVFYLFFELRFSIDFGYKLSNDEGGNDKTTPPFGKTSLRPGGMRASALNLHMDKYKNWVNLCGSQQLREKNIPNHDTARDGKKGDA